MAETAAEPTKEPLPMGPVAGQAYPVKLTYCGECSLPLEYCEYYPAFDKCKLWLEKSLPDLFERLYCGGGTGAVGGEDGATAEAGDADGEGKKSSRQKRGGKGLVKPVKKSGKAADRRIGIARANRGKKKYVTVVSGLAAFEVELKDATKYFSSKFACGSSVTGPDEIVIQGDVKDDLFDLISEKWPEIDEEFIEDLGDRKL